MKWLLIFILLFTSAQGFAQTVAVDETNLYRPMVFGNGRPIAPEVQARIAKAKEQHQAELVAAKAAAIASMTWTLRGGYQIGDELQRWATRAKWRVVWNVPKDHVVPTDTKFYGTFKTAVSKVVEDLVANGAVVSVKFWNGNSVAIISGPGVKGDDDE